MTQQEGIEMSEEPDWMAWRGGRCPVKLGTLVETRRASGYKQHYRTNERDYWPRSPWERGAYPTDPGTDIVAYHVIGATPS